eukprot:6130040-Amphidinium_carterae.1
MGIGQSQNACYAAQQGSEGYCQVWVTNVPLRYKAPSLRSQSGFIRGQVVNSDNQSSISDTHEEEPTQPAEFVKPEATEPKAARLTKSFIDSSGTVLWRLPGTLESFTEFS